MAPEQLPAGLPAAAVGGRPPPGLAEGPSAARSERGRELVPLAPSHTPVSRLMWPQDVPVVDGSIVTFCITVLDSGGLPVETLTDWSNAAAADTYARTLTGIAGYWVVPLRRVDQSPYTPTGGTATMSETTTTRLTTTVELPSPHAVGERAAVILDAIQVHPEFSRLRRSTLQYPECWATFTGYPLIAEWDLDADGPHLFVEALRTMAMKAAVFEFTQDEKTAELDVSAPVDEMVHALTAQFTILSRIQADLSLTFIHSTDNERFAYDAGGYTDEVYRAAGWGELPRRYWIGKAETSRRLDVLYEHYESIGVQRGGRSHFLTFGR